VPGIYSRPHTLSGKQSRVTVIFFVDEKNWTIFELKVAEREQRKLKSNWNWKKTSTDRPIASLRYLQARTVPRSVEPFLHSAATWLTDSQIDKLADTPHDWITGRNRPLDARVHSKRLKISRLDCMLVLYCSFLRVLVVWRQRKRYINIHEVVWFHQVRKVRGYMPMNGCSYCDPKPENIVYSTEGAPAPRPGSDWLSACMQGYGQTYRLTEVIATCNTDEGKVKSTTACICWWSTWFYSPTLPTSSSNGLTTGALEMRDFAKKYLLDDSYTTYLSVYNTVPQWKKRETNLCIYTRQTHSQYIIERYKLLWPFVCNSFGS